MRQTAFPPPESMTTKDDLQAWIDQAILALVNSETPYLEAQLVAAYVLGQSREWVIAHPETILTSSQVGLLGNALKRLQTGEPLAYITGKRSFYGLEFKVSPAVLVPRPETELLVEEAIHWLGSHPNQRNVADVGTGSGIIAITLADTFLDVKMSAVDISEPALAVARENAEAYAVQDRVKWFLNNLLEGIPGPFDLVLANLPYIPSQTLESLAVSKFEPRLALDGGVDGLKLIRALLMQCQTRIQAHGAIFLEIESTLSNEVIELAYASFPQAEVTLVFDYAKFPRLIKIQL